jgi:flagella basal body P-ring formation protein FlgA
VTGNLDSRLRLQKCTSPLTAFKKGSKFGLGSQVIGVKCQSETPWTVYVPVTVKLYKTLVVAAHPLSANHLLSASDVKLTQIDISTLRKDYFEDAKSVVGQQLKYPLAMGSAISSSHIRPQKIVRRGETVTLIAEAGSMQVRMTGMALSDAVLGEKIRVENSSSKRIVEGIVDAPGQVKISM